LRATLYLSACEFAGKWLDAAEPATQPARISRYMEAGPPRAVYIVCDWGGRVLYVGSTVIGVGNRLRQHCADIERTLDWAEVWIIPLRDDTPLAEVRRAEGLIGLALRPLRNRALPDVR
jgi:hypothetical protein